MTESNSTLGSQLGKTATRFAVAILALLVLKTVVSSLPMLKHAPPFEGMLLSPLVLANAVVDTLMLGTIIGFALSLERALSQFYPQFPDARNALLLITALVVIVLAYGMYELPLACVLANPQDLMTLVSSSGFDGSHMAPGLGEAMRQITASMSAELSDVLKNSTGSVLLAYQKLAVFKMRQSPDFYGLLFLILAAVPVVGLIVIGSRNMEAISDLVFHRASALTASSWTKAAGTGTNAERNAAAGAGSGGAKELTSDDMDKLIKLKTLLDQGTITQADFDTQKRIVLQGPVPLEEPVELQRLKQLLDAGALTPEEYEVQKQRFLARL